MHNVALRQRAIKRGLTLSEYALLRLEDNTIVAAATEAEIYNALDLDYVPPELRENSGELEAAANHTLPHLITIEDIRGDLHMHTDATDGRDTIRQMAEAALARGLAYIAITDHSKNLAMTNGLDDTRALAHIKRIREVDAELTNKYEGRIRVLPGIEVDILADGTLDLEDSTLAQMDIVIASVHGHFNQPIEEMTTRVLRAIENPYVRILGHPTGRKVLSREPYAIHIGQILKRAAELGVAVEHNASPARADLNDLHLRLAKEHGCRIVINTDAHSTEELDQMRHGITQLRRAWLTKEDLLNTQPTAEALLTQLRPKP
jgi:DNA polymerase (family 10)